MNLSHLERRHYVQEKTPIEFLSNLTNSIGSSNNIKFYIKRDDLAGISMLIGGGNKARKLEFSMAQALAQGARPTIITSGAVQSNHCRLTLAACNKEHLPCILVLEERVPHSYNPHASGNHYLFQLLGAKQIVVVPEGQAKDKVEELAREYQQAGEDVFVIPGGASNDVGATGYAVCFQEIIKQQQQDDGTKFDYIVTASGSGGTHAGLLAGQAAMMQEEHVQIIGISTRHAKEKQTQHIYNLANGTYKHITASSEEKVDLSSVIVFDDYVGAGYSLPTNEMEEAVCLFARQEGILLDPVYSGKAAAGMIDLCRKGYFESGSNVLFLHTGGAPSLYHYQPLYNNEHLLETSKSDEQEEKKAADF